MIASHQRNKSDEKRNQEPDQLYKQKKECKEK
jgi:hypothetical protein